MPEFKSFIESQFPVSKLSKESYKERKANNSQTLTGLGKWWGRKPLILVRATILGLLMPASPNPEKDRDIFLKILTMDNAGLWLRKDKKISLDRCSELASSIEIDLYFEKINIGKWSFKGSREERENLEFSVFNRMGYDEKLTYCRRPEQVEGPSIGTWIQINDHLSTHANNLSELIQELGIRQFGHIPKVGDAFCGGGSIPFEAARIGCKAFGSDLNPAAALLTWASLNIIGGGHGVQNAVRAAQEKAYQLADKQICEWGIEHNEKGWRADAYLYCIEAKSPASGYWVPLAPLWVISEKYRVCAVLSPDDKNKKYNIEIITGASDAQMSIAKQGTVINSELVCPKTGQRFSINSIRGDIRINGQTELGLRLWENNDLTPRSDDVYQERLYCIRYIETYYELKNDDSITILSKDDAELLPYFSKLIKSGLIKVKTRRHFISPDKNDLERESKVLELLNKRFLEWQGTGILPQKKICSGYNNDQPIRERGWTYWHHLFHPRQLLLAGLLKETSLEVDNNTEAVVGNLLGVGKLANWNSRLCQWLSDSANEKGSHVFFNQALNTLYNFSVRPFLKLDSVWNYNISENYKFISDSQVLTADARNITQVCEFWITDPPYADAINYHELGDFFIAWYEKNISALFPDWYSESKSALAVKGSGVSFNESMVDCFSNFTYLMPANGAQVVMFTHQDSAVWADLALILWASGLQVTAAWTIQTETDAIGIKVGNYVQGTVCMILRKQITAEIGYLADIQADVEFEVRDELHKMIDLDDNEDPNFSDTDYQLAAYVAALRVITSYKFIQDIDIRYELMRTRQPGEISEIQKIINSAVKVACEYLVPSGFDQPLWRQLSGEERFYMKALEIQSHGEYRTGVFGELARGFGLRDYKAFLKSGKANETRLMTAIEYGNKQIGDTGFGKSLVRQVLFAIRETHNNDSASVGRQWLKDELPDYWSSRQNCIKILSHIQRSCSHISHWSNDLKAAEILTGYLQNDMTGS